MYHVAGDEVRDADRDLGHQRQARRSRRVLGDDLLEDADEDRDDEGDDAIITTIARPKTSAGYIIAELDLAPQGVELLELVGDPVERLLEPARALARARPSRGRGGSKTSGWRSIACAQRAAGLDVLRARRRSPPSASRPRSAPRACRASAASACPRRSGSRTGARRPPASRMLTLLKRWKTLSSFSASRFSETSRTIRPRWRSCSETCAFDSASTSPRDGTPGEVDGPEGEGAHRAPPTRRDVDAGGACRAAGRAASAGAAPPSRRFSSSGTEARCSASARVILPRRGRAGRGGRPSSASRSRPRSGAPSRSGGSCPRGSGCGPPGSAPAPRQRDDRGPAPSAVGSSCWVTIPCRAIESCIRTCCCCWGGKTSMIRSTVCAVDWVCRVANTRWPVSAAVSAVEIVSRSRISPTRITSGSSRRAAFRASAKSVASAPISRWLTMQLLVAVQELDRVLDREDVLLALLVDHVDHRRQRGRLARAGRAGDEHEAARLAGELREHRRQAELVEARDLVRDQAEGGADRAALEEAVDAEAGDARDRVGEVELLLVLEPLALVVVEDRVDDLARVLRGRAAGSRPCGTISPVDADRRREARA